ncbi:MAG: peptidylprolyl isomerase [Oscillospiraceae bacterium]|nr:peptidylprolyl isomerase [Oscillospiraceae bacterium]
MEKVKVTMENGGEFIIELYPEEAPITCENFLKLVKSGFYNGLTFHRVIDGFMAQGGDPEGTGCGGSKEQIKGEFKRNGVNNNLSHTRGVVSMARSQMPDSASSQFFICYDDSCTFLDGQYAAFGKVTEGMEVVDDFLKIERRMSFGGERSTPVTPIVMKTVEVID